MLMVPSLIDTSNTVKMWLVGEFVRHVVCVCKKSLLLFLPKLWRYMPQCRGWLQVSSVKKERQQLRCFVVFCVMSVTVLLYVPVCWPALILVCVLTVC